MLAIEVIFGQNEIVYSSSAAHQPIKLATDYLKFMKIKRPLFLLLICCALILSASWQLFAGELSYDKYAATLKEPKQATQLEKSLYHFPVLPFALMKYPTTRVLNYVEKHKIPEKISWMYDWAQNRGVTPNLSIMGMASLNSGAELDLIRLLKLKETMPDVVAESSIQYTRDLSFQVASRLGFERIKGTGFRTLGSFQYENRPMEHYYGLGPNTSKGEGYVYEREQTDLEYLIGYKPGTIYSADAKFGYRNINISGGSDGGRGRWGEGLLGPQVSGISGDKLLWYGLNLERDTRNQGGVSTQGSFARAFASYNDGVGSSDAGFFQYILEGSKYLTLGSHRRVLAGHFYLEHNNETNGHSLPFHQMARLGGFGPFNYLSQTLRGYEENRFTDDSLLLFNLEYRYNIWEYRDWKTDAVIFADCGQVFGHFGKMQMDNFRVSYGTGLRTSFAKFVVLSLELAHGDEGTAYYAKSSTPF